MKTLPSYYEVLGVGPTAEAETLRKAYRRLARKHHPDVSSDPRAHENMARINEAFETLIDPARRTEYDAWLAGAAVPRQDAEQRVPSKPVVVRLIDRLTAHKTPVYACAFAPDTGQLVSAGFDNELIWWDEATHTPARRTKLDAGVVSTLRAFTLDRVVCAGSAESQVTISRLDECRLEAFRVSSEEWVSALAISPDGSAVAAGSLYHTLVVTNAYDGTVMYRTENHTDAVTAIAWSEDGRLLAVGRADSSVSLVDASNGVEIAAVPQVRSAVTAMAFSGDGRFLAVAGVDLSIRVFDLFERQLVKMMFGHTKVVEALAFHPNRWLFASASRDGTVGLWNAAKGIGNVRIECSSRPISCIAFSPDGTRLAAGGQDRLVRLWRVAAKDQA